MSENRLIPSLTSEKKVPQDEGSSIIIALIDLQRILGVYLIGSGLVEEVSHGKIEAVVVQRKFDSLAESE